jgi:hypothetical protein
MPQAKKVLLGHYPLLVLRALKVVAEQGTLVVITLRGVMQTGRAGSFFHPYLLKNVQAGEFIVQQGKAVPINCVECWDQPLKWLDVILKIYRLLRMEWG